MPTVALLGDLGASGFFLKGQAGDRAGSSVSNAGDINGDGFDDIIIGSPYSDVAGTDSGSAYVIYGGPGGFGNIDLANIAPFQGFKIIGNGHAGVNVSGAGDVNGDGFADVIVSAFQGVGNITPLAYVIFGKAAPPATIDLAHLAASDGFQIIGPTTFSFYSTINLSVSSAGDVNGDGFDDIVIGAPDTEFRGMAYVVFGRASGFGTVDLNALDAAHGFTITGSAQNDELGFSVSGAGDVNGDGFDDVIIAAPFADAGGAEAGQAYVIFGKAGGFPTTIDVANLGTSGFIIRGHVPGDVAAISVSGAGDINGDGFADIIIGSGSQSTDAAYVIFGKASGFGAVDLNNLGSAGFLIKGSGGAGFKVAAAGDVNRDGFADLIVSVPGADGAYVILGKASGFVTVDLDHLSPGTGFLIQGALSSFTGGSLSGGGDINHDGYADIIIGAPNENRGDPSDGAAYVVFGGPGLGLATAMLAPSASASDFNGDGLSDILWRSNNGLVTDWLSSGASFYGNATNFLAQLDPSWQVAGTGDFNGDGRTDLLWRSASGLVTDWLSAGNGFYGNSGNFLAQLDAAWHIAATGDFNGDGLTDILWRSDSGLITDWLANPNGSLYGNSAHFLSQLDPSWKVAGVGDFNGDGIDDLLLRKNDGTVTDWLGQANGSFIANSGNFQVQVGNSWHIVGTGHFNNDAFADILWRSDTGQVTDWLATPNGSFYGNAANFLVVVPSNVAQVGDFNGDGIDDILWRANDGSLTNSFGQVNGAFAANATFHSHIDSGWHVQPQEVLV